MNLIFAGTPSFAVPSLKCLIQSEHAILTVLTQPDRPSGRGKKIQPSPIKQLAEQHQLSVLQPSSLKDTLIQKKIMELNPDAIIVVAYGLMIPTAILEGPMHGCINIHPSQLPRWRGPTPIQSALLHGDSVTGVSIMKLDEGMDTGPVYSQIPYTIKPNDTSETVHNTLAQRGAEQLLTTLNKIEKEHLKPQKQSEVGVTLTQKIKKSDGKIDWKNQATTILNQIRAFNPWPVCFTTLNTQTLRIFEAELTSMDNAAAKPGQIINFSHKGLDVACGTGVLRITSVQRPGAKRSSIANFYNALKDKVVVNTTVLC